MPEEFDPKLKEAMEEIDAIMKKYDIGGFVHLTSMSHAEYKLYLEPTWSMASYEEASGQVVLRFKFRKAKHDQCNSTAHMIYSTRDMCGYTFTFLENIARQLEKQIEVEHKPHRMVDPDNPVSTN